MINNIASVGSLHLPLENSEHTYPHDRFPQMDGIAGLLGIPNLWFDVFTPFLHIGLLLITILTWIITDEFSSSLFGILLYLGMSLGIGIVALSLEPKPEKRNYLALPLLLFYNMFLDGIRIMSLTEETVNILMDWEITNRRDI